MMRLFNKPKTNRKGGRKIRPMKNPRFADLEAQRIQMGMSISRMCVMTAQKLNRDHFGADMYWKLQRYQMDPPTTVLAALGCVLGMDEIKIPCTEYHIRSAWGNLQAVYAEKRAMNKRFKYGQ